MSDQACPCTFPRAMMRNPSEPESSPDDSLSRRERGRVRGNLGTVASFSPAEHGKARQRRWRRQALRWGWYGTVVIATLVVFVGCRATVGSIIGQQFVSSTYTFAVPLPGDEWTLTSADPAVLTLAHPQFAAGINISVTCDRERQAPLSILARHLFFGFREVEILQQEARTLDGAPALQTVARARLDGAQVQVNSYVVQRQGCVYDLVYFASPQEYSRGEPSFARMLDGFRFQSR
jgi:hypothetical protein